MNTEQTSKNIFVCIQVGKISWIEIEKTAERWFVRFYDTPFKYLDPRLKLKSADKVQVN